MSASDVDRLDQDLTTIRRLLKTDRPYDRGDVAPLLLIAMGALLALPLLSLRLGSPRVCLLCCLAPGLLLVVRRYMSANQRRTERPNLWLEYKLSAIAVIILIPAVIGWIWWGMQFGLTRIQAGAPLVFSIGIAAVLIGIADSSRRSYAILGAAFVVSGICLLLIKPSQVPYWGSSLLAATSLGNAVWIYLATRDDATILSGDGHE